MSHSPAHSDGTIGKALDLLDIIAAAGRPLRFTELLSLAPYPRATLHRFLQTLLHQGMLSYDPDRQSYSLGLRLVRLAHAAWAGSSLAPLAGAELDALSQALGESIHLAQLDQGQVLYVDKRHATRPAEMFAQAGRIGPAYCTGVGKAMLAWLEPKAQDEVLAQQSFHRFTPQTLSDINALRAELIQIRARGFARDNEEHEAGIICIAVPILSQSGRMIGALSVTSLTARMSLRAMEAWLPQLQASAARIAALSEAWDFPEARR